LFDDIVFNCIAFFDYFGRLAGMFLQESDSIKLRWDKLYKWSKHPNAGGQVENRIHGTQLAQLVIREDERWVRRITAYRSSAIHYHAEKLDGQVKFSFTRREEGGFAANHLLDVWVPGAFLRALRIS